MMFLLVFAGVMAMAAPSVLAVDAPSTPAVGPPTDSIAWTARVPMAVGAHSAPRADARVVARIDRVTAFWRRPQRVLVVSRIRTDAAGRQWVAVRLPGRPNRSRGWVPVDAVRLGATKDRIVVRIRARAVELWRAGRRVGRWHAAVGTGSTPTPTGLFAIQDPVPSVGAQRSYLGPYILTLTAYSEVLSSFMGGNGLVAIHGTDAPGLLGRAVSHGCIRVSNGAVRKLYSVVHPGTPVEIVR
jgi:lipoprotein-anchoring transpeptidase ErfK/SrfK